MTESSPVPAGNEDLATGPELAPREEVRSDDKKLVRMMRLLSLVQSGRPHTPGSLARELGVGERSVHRYIKDLEKAGIPLEFDH